MALYEPHCKVLGYILKELCSSHMVKWRISKIKEIENFKIHNCASALL